MEACRDRDLAYPGQDGQHGRDAQASKGRLHKQGGGAAGFDFVPLDIHGKTIGLDEKGSPVEAHACVRDAVTGLVWRVGMPQEEALGPEEARAMVDLARREAWCGFSDWRLPHLRELLSLGHFDRLGIGIDPTFFPDVRKEWYRSADLLPGRPDLVKVFSYEGKSNNGLKSFAMSQDRAFWLRLVRGEPSKARFKAKPGGTVLDESTGLVWDACVFGQRGKRCEKGRPLHMDWTEALRLVQKLNARRYKGFSDWRLPNAKEFYSIVDEARIRPAIDPTFFPKAEKDWYWTSTTRVYFTGGVHTTDFVEGYTRFDNKWESYYLRLVRGGL